MESPVIVKCKLCKEEFHPKALGSTGICTACTVELMKGQKKVKRAS